MAATSRKETIPKKKAEAYLATMGPNRRLSRMPLERIVGVLERGEWMLNGATIVFDDQGRLMDGQHRLQGVVDTGIPIETFVIRGIDPEAFKTVDNVNPRTLSGALRANRGVPNENAVAAAVSFHWRLTRPGGFRQNARPTITQGLDHFDSHHEFQGWVSCAREIKGMPSAYAGVLYAIHLRHRNANEFHEALVNAQPGAPFLMRKLITKDLLRPAGTGKLETTNKMALVIKCYNAWSENRKLTRLQWGGGEAFPVIRP